MAEEIVEADFTHEITQKILKEQATLHQAKDWPDFKQRVGHIKGLKSALETFSELIKRQLRYDEDDDEGSDEDIDEEIDALLE